MSKIKICKKPFEWFEVTDAPGNPVHLCCSGWVRKPAGFLSTNSPTEIWNSKVANQIRRSVLDGSFSYCNKELCPHITTVTEYVQIVDEDEHKMYWDSLDNQETTFMPKTLNCSYDKSCNLSCPSCRSKILMAKKSEQNRLNKLSAWGEVS